MVDVEEKNGRKILHLSNGEKQEADLVLYGIGDVMNTEYLSDGFLDSRDNSVLLNKYLQSTLNDNVFACGDLAKFPVSGLGYKKVAHYSEAISQGTHAAWNMLGKKISYITCPFFWTRFFN